MKKLYSRRDMLKRSAQALALAATVRPSCLLAETNPRLSGKFGAIVDERVGAQIGQQVLEAGGNAIDAVVAASLASCIATPGRCGIGGYGGHMTVALAGGRKITSIDYNSTAPGAARADMFPLDDTDAVIEKKNVHGWLAAGVPGTLAGLQMALDRYGTRSFRELAQPAIRLAREGVLIDSFFARSIRGTAGNLRKDPGSAKIFLEHGQPRKEGELLRNPELAQMLATLAERNSVDSFYRGDIAQRLAEQFRKNGGLVTARDLAAYHAREVEPLRLEIKNFTVFTAPLTAGGLTVLQALSILKALNWKRTGSFEATHARIEAVRYAWKDRLELLGDPEMVPAPVDRLLSEKYAHEIAARVRAAVRAKTPAAIHIGHHEDEGTNNISCVDRHGNMVAATFTHGSTFGAQVTADGLGVTLGHGMSRFDPHSDHPNSPGPGKRPLHNMCPSVVLRHGQPVLAVGGAGGLRIPNSLYDVLINYLIGRDSMADSIAAPRILCTGTRTVGFEKKWPEAQVDYLRKIGFNTRTDVGAYVSAVSWNPKTGECAAAAR